MLIANFYEAARQYNYHVRDKEKAKSGATDIGFNQDNSFDQNWKDPIDLTIDYTDLRDVLIELAHKYHFNWVFLLTGKGTPYPSSDIPLVNRRYFEVCNIILEEGALVHEFFERVKISHDLYDLFVRGCLEVRDIHWKGLISNYDVSPLYAFDNHPDKFIEL